VLGWARPAGANMEMCIKSCALKVFANSILVKLVKCTKMEGVIS
jgi:hypothetical protein